MHNEINRLRKTTQGALGARHDLRRRYSDAVVKTGAVPMTVPEQQIDARIAAA
ncbi:hypothetical protein [Sandaracinobacteroides hominis]|uniref:hypothetical protein n=1 Tax=Sandaracinobacteroides hominis TaxID=2780086 RepID=UPI0018F7C8AF|nr:hypothetical protein [Sandaracinobacteroides hominis]